MVLVEFYRALGRHKLLIFAGTLACVLLALALTLHAQKIYEATAVVRIEPTGTADANARFEASQHLTGTYAEIYTGGGLLGRMETVLGPRTPVDRNELRAKQVKDLDLLAVSARSPNPRLAARIANAGTAAMERFSSTERIAVITPATTPTSPASPKPVVNIVLALLLGLVLNVAIALTLDALRQPLPDADSIEEEFGVPVLAQVPRVRFGGPERRGVRAAEEGRSADEVSRAALAAPDQKAGG